jgi:hypothetical protein
MSRTYSDAVRMIERDWARAGLASRGAGLHTLGQLWDLGVSPRVCFPDGTQATFNTGLVHGPEARVVCDLCSGDGEGDHGPCPDCGGEGVLYVLWVNLNVDRVV